MFFEAGLFLIMLGLAIIFAVAKFPYKGLFHMLSCVIFMILGFMVFSNIEVGFTSSTTDGITIINQTSYIIGNGYAEFNTNSMWLGLIFSLASIVMAGATFLEIMDSKKKNASQE